MFNEKLVPGTMYRIRLTNGNWTNGIYIRERISGGGSWGRAMTHFLFTNTASGREIEIKSRIRIKPVVIKAMPNNGPTLGTVLIQDLEGSL